MAGRSLPARPGGVQFTQSERADITRILSDPAYGVGTRAAHFMRQYGHRLTFSVRAKLIYVLMAGFVGQDKNRFTVPLKRIAGWADCTPRSAQRAIRELTRSGPLPLLLETPGRPGKVSEYRLVHDPFTVAAQQAADAERTRQRREAAKVAAERAAREAAFAAHPDNSVAACDALAEAVTPIRKKARHLLPTRKVPVVVSDFRHAMQQAAQRAEAAKPPLTPEQQAGLSAIRDTMKKLGIRTQASA